MDDFVRVDTRNRFVLFYFDKIFMIVAVDVSCRMKLKKKKKIRKGSSKRKFWFEYQHDVVTRAKSE